MTRGSWAYTQYGIPRLVRPHGGPTNAQPRIAIRHSANVPVRGPAPAARRAPRPPRRAPAGAPAHARSAALKRFPRRPDPRRPGPGPREGRSQTPRRAPAPAPIFVFFSSDERPARPRGGTVQPPDRRQPPRAAVDPASSVTAGRSGVARWRGYRIRPRAGPARAQAHAHVSCLCWRPPRGAVVLVAVAYRRPGMRECVDMARPRTKNRQDRRRKSSTAQATTRYRNGYVQSSAPWPPATRAAETRRG